MKWLVLLATATTAVATAVPSLALRAQGSSVHRPRAGVEHLRGGDSSTPEDAEEAFRSLMDMSGCSSTLRLRSGERGRGLFTASEVGAGEVLLTVPLKACLVEPRVINEEQQERLLGRKLAEGNCHEGLPRLSLQASGTRGYAI